MTPLGLTKYRLAKDIGVPPQRIGDIVPGKRAIAANTDLRLCRYFGPSGGSGLLPELRGPRDTGQVVTRRLSRPPATAPAAAPVNSGDHRLGNAVDQGAWPQATIHR